MAVRKLTCVLAFMFVLLSLLTGAGAELDLTGSNDCGIAIIYYPARASDAEIATARFVAKALGSVWDGQDYWNSNITINKIYHRKDSPAEQRIRSENLKEKSRLQDEHINALASRDYHLWFIVPGSAAKDFCDNTELIQQLEGLSRDRIMKIHAVFVGDEVKEPSAESELGRFAAKTGKADWISIASDYQSKSRRTQANRQIHTGDYFLASLFGIPADLRTVEQGESEFTFEMPENGDVLLLARGVKLNQNDKIEVRGLEEDSVEQIEKKTFYVANTGNKLEAFSGILLRELPSGSYTVKIPQNAESLSVFDYPKLEEIIPSMKIVSKSEEDGKAGMQEDDNGPAEQETDFLYRGEYEIQVMLGNDLGRAEAFHVKLRISSVTGGNEKTGEPVDAEYDGERKLWTLLLPVGMEDQQFTILSEISMDAENGNGIWEWQSESKTLKVEPKEIKKKSDQPAEVTLYYDSEKKQSGTLRIRWEDFFAYNMADRPEFELIDQTVLEEAGFRFETGTDGFTVTAEDLSSETEKERTVEFQCIQGENRIMAGFTLKVFDLRKLAGNILLQTESEEVKAGEEITFRATIPAETVKAYQAAIEQNANFVGPENMILKTSRFGDEYTENEEKKKKLTETENGWAAEIRIQTLENQPEGESQYQIGVYADNTDPNTTIVSRNQTIRILNTRPWLNEDQIIPKEITVEAGGVPYEWEGISILKTVFGPGEEISLFEKLLGKKDLLSCFTDDESEIKSVTVSIEPTEKLLLEKPEEDRNPEEEQGESSLNQEIWEQTVVPGNTLRKVTTKPGISPRSYTIRITASDGINQSEELTVKMTVRSSTMRLLSWIGLGFLGALLILILILVIHRVRKPSFNSINVRCLVTNDGDQGLNKELLQKSDAVPMMHFGKKEVALSTVLVMTHQPPMINENVEITQHIFLKPARKDGLNIVYDKKAQEQVGRQDKMELIPLGETSRLRIGSTYILIENVA